MTDSMCEHFVKLRFMHYSLSMFQLQVLNLGNNALEEFSPILQHLHSLEKLHLFGNNITQIHSSSLSEF